MAIPNEEYFATILKNQDNSKKGVTIKMLMADSDGQFLYSDLFLYKHRELAKWCSRLHSLMKIALPHAFPLLYFLLYELVL